METVGWSPAYELAWKYSDIILQEFNQAYATNRLLMVMRVDADTKEVAVVADDMKEGQFDAIRSYIQVKIIEKNFTHKISFDKYFNKVKSA